MRKHSTWLWSIIIVFVVISFVFWGTNPGGPGGAGGRGQFGSIDGKVVTEQALINARRIAMLQFFFRYGQWPDGQAQRAGYDLLEEAYKILLLNHKLEEMGIVAGKAAKATVAGNLLSSLRPQGINNLSEFEQALLKRENLSLADLDRFIEHEVAVRQLAFTKGLPGRLVTPQMAESLYRRENQELSVQAVFFSASNYLSRVEVTSEAVGQFFTNQMALYRIPERVRVKYVAFPVEDYAAKAEERMAALPDLDQYIEARYRELGTNYFSEAATTEEKKALVRDEILQRQKIFEARLAAAAFADTLMRKEPMRAEDLETLAAEQGLTVRVSEPFPRDGAPAGLAVNVTFAQQAFRLTGEEPFGSPIVGDEAVYVMALLERLPSENAVFEDVRERVEERYRLQEATRMAREAGTAFASQVTNDLAAGRSFAEAAAAAGHTPVMLPPFSQNTRSLPEVEAHTPLQLFKQVALTTPPGESSGLQFTSGGGYVLFPVERLPVDEARMRAELPDYLDFVRQGLANETFNLWFSQEAQTGLRDTPLHRREPPSIGPGG